MRFLVSGAARGLDVDARVRSIEAFAAQEGWGNAMLWWARRRRKCVASAMVLVRPGRTGMLLHSPATARGVDTGLLARLIEAVSAEGLRQKLAMVQSLVDPLDQCTIGVLKDAGYQLLAKLICLRLGLPVEGEYCWNRSLKWLDHRDFSEADLARVISCTYEGSLDCPQLRGLREMSDVIAGHRAGGAFRPEAWLIASLDGCSAGCILVNDSRVDLSAEVAYMGVAPSCRGKGVGAAMLGRSAELAFGRGRDSITLSVDSRNHHAVNRYLMEGFIAEETRLAFMVSAG